MTDGHFAQSIERSDQRVVRCAEDFAGRLVGWQRRCGRHDLPWQGGDAYRVWLSEVMLQQTQVATVIPYFQRFVARFPSLAALAAADEEAVLALWSGLGYYSRARNLHRAARQIQLRHDGFFPQHLDALLALPGIGRSTAAAILALAFHQRHAILDGNVKRVLARHGAVAGWPGSKPVEAALWSMAEARLPVEAVATYTQALMDLGATVCRRSRPGCQQCPVATDCQAYQAGRVAEFPQPRPKKALPERLAVFLLLRQGAEILLEKRPPSGIWGGLWCLPQFDSVAEAVAGAAEWGAEPGASTALLGFAHTFTHFKMQVQPLAFDLVRPSCRATESAGAQWFSRRAALAAGIPTPIRRILAE